MIGLDAIGMDAVGVSFTRAPVIVPVPDPVPSGDIDANKVPAARTVIFGGSVRVVNFPGSIRTVSF